MLYRLSALLLFAAVLITSCGKENIDTVVPEEPVYEPDTVVVNNVVTGLSASSPNGLEIECITLLYPIEFELLSGDVITVNTAEEFDAALLETGEQQIIDFVYPVEFINGDGEEEVAENLFELGNAFASCIPTDGWGEDGGDHDLLPAFLFSDLCFDLVYPVDLQDIDGNIYTANDEQELIDLIAEIVELFFVMPINVVDSDGEVQTIEDSGQFFELTYDCNDISPPVLCAEFLVVGFACSEIVYPFDVILEDGSVITIEDENQYAELILNGTEIELQFPFSLLNPDGETITVENCDELIITFIEDCGIDIVVDTTNLCGAPAHILLFFNQGIGPTNCGYNIVYPLQVEAGGVVYDINSGDDYWEIYNQFNWNEIELLYPVNGTDIDGNPLQLNSDADICEIIENCGG